jgi:hypothetical protein
MLGKVFLISRCPPSSSLWGHHSGLGPPLASELKPQGGLLFSEKIREGEQRAVSKELLLYLCLHPYRICTHTSAEGSRGSFRCSWPEVPSSWGAGAMEGLGGLAEPRSLRPT